MEVYAQYDYGTFQGGTFWTWMTIGGSRQWYISSLGGFQEAQLQLTFRNGQVGEVGYGAFYLAAETG